LKPLFPGKTEGSQFLEQMAILGTPSKSQFEKMASNIPKTTFKMLNQLEKFERKDLADLMPKFYKKREIKQAIDLIESMLEWDPKERVTAEEALQHPFLQPSDDSDEDQ
jgi:serine/threonine protein kinase